MNESFKDMFLRSLRDGSYDDGLRERKLTFEDRGNTGDKKSRGSRSKRILESTQQKTLTTCLTSIANINYGDHPKYFEWMDRTEDANTVILANEVYREILRICMKNPPESIHLMGKYGTHIGHVEIYTLPSGLKKISNAQCTFTTEGIGGFIRMILQQSDVLKLDTTDTNYRELCSLFYKMVNPAER